MLDGLPMAYDNRRSVRAAALAAFVLATTYAGISALGQPLPARLERLLTHLPQPAARCSALVVDLETGRTLCSVNPTEAMVPASNAKLFPLAAAADQLGPGFHFRTVLAVRGADLVLIGDGDPALGDVDIVKLGGVSVEAMTDRWAQALTEHGRSRIDGDLIIDESIFDAQWVHPTWEEADLKKWYAAPVGALNYNDNCVDITIWPGKSPGGAPRWESVPKTGTIKLTFRNRQRNNGKPVIDRPGAELRFVVTGRPTKRWTFGPVSAPDPGLLAAHAVRSALADRGIHINGNIVRRRVRGPDGTLPEDCRVVAEQVTPLAAVLARTGKNSQNLFAECLAKRLGYEWARRRGQSDPQGNWQNGSAALAEFLSACRPPAAGARLVDGSGLSRDNRASAADFVSVLQYMHRHQHRQLFVDSLAIAGQDGSLRKRMRDLPGTVYAKTGYLRGIRTLSGYVVTPQGRWRAFSVLFNGIKGGTAAFNAIHDKLCRTLMAEATNTQP
ncbi:MAG: D-alanyl-D-alanine carboxypeptidase/D-alanyl-D-alanine-endopeptidase [bacterium]|nr:D-alanyl-D-alanine carboxypeptidase/D-alanyl-D-alanine-endopeptidase [bacterium]